MTTEFGYLHVTDPKKIHVIGVDPHEDMVWRWRVFIPEDGKYELCSEFGSIPKEKLPGESIGMPLGCGQSTVSVRVLLRYLDMDRVAADRDQRNALRYGILVWIALQPETN